MFTAFRKAAALNRVAQAVQSALDQYYHGVTAMMRGEGGSFVDDMGGTITTTGTPRRTTAVSEVKVGSGALGFSSVDTMTLANRPEYKMPGDFTVEFWMMPIAYPATGTEAGLVMRHASGVYPTYGGFLEASGRFRAIWGNGVNGTTVGLSQFYSHPSGQKVPLGQWTHICQQRRNGACELYVNGVLIATGGYGQTDSSNTLPLTIAKNYEGYLDHVRITNGYARYKGNFTPPAQDYQQDGPDPYYDKVTLLMHMDGANGGTVFKDEKGHTFSAFAGASTAQIARPGFGNCVGEFRTGGYLTAESPDFQLGFHNFTLEGMCYLPAETATAMSTGVHRTMLQKGKVGTSNFEYRCSLLGYDGSNMQLMLTTSEGGQNTQTWPSQLLSYASVATPGWHHWAIVRDGNTLRFFWDGVARGTQTLTTGLYFSSGQLSIGGNPDGNDAYRVGFLDEFRITKGVARYNAAFTPPKKAFPSYAVKPTKLLLHAEGQQSGDASEFPKQVMVTCGFSTDAKFGTQCFQPNGGTSEYVAATDPGLQLGADDFTFEFFLKGTQSVSTAPGAIIAMLDVVNTDSANGGAIGGLLISAAGVHTSLNGTSWVTHTTNMPLGQGIFNTGAWVHMAVVRFGSKMMLFIDGIKRSEVVIGTGAIFPRVPGRVQLGSSNNVHGSYPCKIDEVRFSKKAVYTANFAVPTAPFEA